MHYKLHKFQPQTVHLINTLLLSGIELQELELTVSAHCETAVGYVLSRICLRSAILSHYSILPSYFSSDTLQRENYRLQIDWKTRLSEKLTDCNSSELRTKSGLYQKECNDYYRAVLQWVYISSRTCFFQESNKIVPNGPNFRLQYTLKSLYDHF